MRIRNKDELLEAAEAFIDASQRVKAAQEVLKQSREAIIPAFNKFCRADEDGNRTLEFGPTKIMLVPYKKVDETALRARLGTDTHRFTKRNLTIALHVIQHKLGAGVACRVEQAIRNAVGNLLQDEPTLLRDTVKVRRELDVSTALASLPREEQKEVKVEVSQTLRPYPEKQGFRDKIRAAVDWLGGKRPAKKTPRPR
jgi:hypothetical protein